MTAKKKITDKNGVQVFPITHTKAVLDDNGNSVEQRLQEQMDLINQKQLEVGAVPSDIAPTKGSTNWVTSGGVYNTTSSLRQDVDDAINELNPSIKLSGWENGTLATNHTYNNSHIRIITTAVIGFSNIVLSVADGYAVAVHEYNERFYSVHELTETAYIKGTSWITGDRDFSLSPETKTIAVILAVYPVTSGASAVTITPPEGDNLSISYKDVAGIDVIREQAGKVDSLEKEALIKEAEPPSIEQSGDTRVWIVFDGVTRNYTFSAKPLNNSYQVAYIGRKGSIDVDSSGWTNGFDDYAPTTDDITKVIINVRKVGNLDITVNEAIENISYSCFINTSTVEYIKGFLPRDYSHEYYGDTVKIKKTFDIINNGVFPISLTTNNQGMAIYNQYCVQGMAIEDEGKTKAQLLDLDNRTLIADLLLSHDGYSAIHCNTMCFGAETASGGIMPALYVSQWNNQKCCFVYDITTTDATLLQVIDPSQLTKDGVRFGLGNVDWIVDTKHGWLFALSYKGDNYSVGQIITKFALPALSDGSVVSLTDADIIDSAYIGDYIIRQDGCYRDNKLYLLFGSTSSYAQYLAVHVIDVFTLREVTTIPLQFVNKEPEGIDVYNGDLVIHLINENLLKKFIFS